MVDRVHNVQYLHCAKVYLVDIKWQECKDFNFEIRGENIFTVVYIKKYPMHIDVPQC